MSNVGQQQANYFPRDMSPHVGPRQPHNRAPQNPGAPPAAYDDQPGGHWENAPPPGWGVAEPDHRLHDPRHIDVAYHGPVDYHPPPLRDPAVQYVFPNVGNVQGIHAQPQSNVPYQQYARFGYVPLAPGPAPPPIPDPSAYGIPAPTPGQTAAGNLRRLASRILRHPNTHVNMVSMEPHAAGHCNVVIILKVADALAFIVPEDDH